MKETETKQSVVIELLARLKSNHHVVRSALNKGKVIDAFDSLNWEEGVIDSLILIVSKEA